MPRQTHISRTTTRSSGSEKSGSAKSRRKPLLVMMRRPGLVLSERLFQRRRAFGPHRHVEGGNWSERVLYLQGRREARGNGLWACLYSEDEDRGLERALPIIVEAIAAGRLSAWVESRSESGKVETLPTEQPRADWVQVATEVRRLALMAATDCGFATVAAARLLRCSPWLLDLLVKFAREQSARWDRAPRFMMWASAPGGKRVLVSGVDLVSGLRLNRRLNTDDSEKEGPRRLRLLLWHAIADGQLPGGSKHEAWRLYGGKIPGETKRLLRRLRALPWAQYVLHREIAAKSLGYCASTIDWLTNHEEDRRQDPLRRARCDATLRSQHRETKPTPISRAWQFSRTGRMVRKHKSRFYARITIGHFSLEWPLAAQNGAEAEAQVKPALAALARIKEAARAWRECLVGSPEAKSALAAVLYEQRRFRDALVAIGVTRTPRWAEADRVLNGPPLDETSRSGRAGCTLWFVQMLRKNPERPPPGRPVEMLLQEADALFRVGRRGARRCYEFAQEKTGNRNWSMTRRPRKSAS
jgi:hypothetical protein